MGPRAVAAVVEPPPRGQGPAQYGVNSLGPGKENGFKTTSHGAAESLKNRGLTNVLKRMVLSDFCLGPTLGGEGVEADARHGGRERGVHRGVVAQVEVENNI